jgi:hypothetical protein
MSSLRWTLPGFFIGLVLFLAPGCGTGAEKCNASTCPAGCCTLDGRCDPGTQNNACGLSGALCQTCSGADHCSGGVCTPLSGQKVDAGTTDAGNSDGGTGDGGTGDGGTSDGGVTCDSTNCNTCCVNDQCVTQVNNLTCGTGGNTCQTCTGAQTCTSGVCQDNSCTGCVSSSGACLTTAEQNNTQCGSGGVTCATCPSGTACQNGTCVTTGGCTSCSTGCCSGTTCLPGTSLTACGSSGNACTSCSSGQSCTATATGGQCQTTTTAQVGSACTSNSQCTALGTGAYCKLTNTLNTASYPGGYCTKPCMAVADCGASATCADFREFGEADFFCISTSCTLCSSRGAGYTCHGQNLCWLTTLPPNPVAPANLIGSACTSNSQCQNGGAYTPGDCLPSSNGFTGGYCFGTCTYNTMSCGSGAVCLSAGNNTNVCLRSCSAPGGGQSTCRTGYVCYDYGQATGYCWPNCNNPGGSCGTSFTCQASGYCQ